MSDEFDNSSENYSAFWPLLVLLSCLILWLGYQVVEINNQRGALSQQFQGAVPAIKQAQGVGQKYVELMKDLVDTSAKDQTAAQIVKDAIQAGWIQVKPNATNSTTTPAAPTN